jgi:regulator of replication initiation timing
MSEDFTTEEKEAVMDAVQSLNAGVTPNPTIAMNAILDNAKFASELYEALLEKSKQEFKALKDVLAFVQSENERLKIETDGLASQLKLEKAERVWGVENSENWMAVSQGYLDRAKKAEMNLELIPRWIRRYYCGDT